ncbi:sigma-70 family RNA polymerase sigma factor [Nocardioides mangrovi]|uniref:Sigma-70 family RNA polymerase sigma factor n=1 Tax=Nocardioides mangrovi TaxID=2874580 RepID=A0ABS7UIG4_9ACTN|nr:sigma-70 family RNA polymerase sigma factor [Nocardioides mangrovi]MBZ5740595.1 sigma-70 family RNA polymerase sigma factor [Nocardioides mangrovi]
MGSTVSTLDGRSDAELISAVRAGDVAAYGELFSRHVDAARRLGRQLVPGPDVDDLVSEAFAKVLVVLQRGGGPDLAFRAYLLTAVRRLHVDRIRASSRLHTTDDLTPFDPGVPFRDTAVEGFESATAARAFASLPERWQLVLWHTEVEGQKPAEVAPLLGMTPNSVSALAYRAREGLRQSYLALHAQTVDDDECERTRAQLGAYVRGGLAKRDAHRVEKHLDECRACAAIYLELTEVNSNLRAVLAPLLLGAAAAAYLGTTGSVGVAGGGVLVLLGRARDAVVSHAPTAAVSGAAASAVVAGLVVALHQGAATEPPSAGDAPVVQVTPTGTTGPDDAPRQDRRSPSTTRADRVPSTTAAPTAPTAPTAADDPSAPSSTAPSAGSTPSSPPATGGPTSGPTSSSPTVGPGDGPTSGPDPSEPPVVDVHASVSAGADGVEVGLGLGLGGATIIPDTTVGVPFPTSG